MLQRLFSVVLCLTIAVSCSSLRIPTNSLLSNSYNNRNDGNSANSYNINSISTNSLHTRKTKLLMVAKGFPTTVIPKNYNVAIGFVLTSLLCISSNNYLAGIPIAIIGVFLAIQTGKVRFVFDNEALEIFVAKKDSNSNSNGDGNSVGNSAGNSVSNSAGNSNKSSTTMKANTKSSINSKSSTNLKTMTKAKTDNKETLIESGENFAVGGKNRWKYNTFTNWFFIPSKDFPVLMYFKETQTDPKGQLHLFPVIMNGKVLYDTMMERIGPKDPKK